VSSRKETYPKQPPSFVKKVANAYHEVKKKVPYGKGGRIKVLQKVEPQKEEG